MGVLGYDTWDKFSEAVDRAKQALATNGVDTSLVFSGAAKNYKSRNRHGEFEASKPDYHIVRQLALPSVYSFFRPSSYYDHSLSSWVCKVYNYQYLTVTVFIDGTCHNHRNSSRNYSSIALTVSKP